MNDRTQRLAAILERAKHIHGVVAERTQGRDADWALFYAWWLINWSDLPEVLGSAPALGELTAALVHLDREYLAEPRVEPWAEFYARELLARLG